MLMEFVSGEVAAVLGLDASQPVPLEKGLFELGMDSLMSVELKRRLERGAGRALPSTLTFNYPNVAALAPSSTVSSSWRSRGRGEHRRPQARRAGAPDVQGRSRR